MSKNHATSAMTKKDGGTKGGKDSHRDKQRQTTYAMAVQKQPLAICKQGTNEMNAGTKERMRHLYTTSMTGICTR